MHARRWNTFLGITATLFSIAFLTLTLLAFRLFGLLLATAFSLFLTASFFCRLLLGTETIVSFLRSRTQDFPLLESDLREKLDAAIPGLSFKCAAGFLAFRQACFLLQPVVMLLRGRSKSLNSFCNARDPSSLGLESREKLRSLQRVRGKNNVCGMCTNVG